MMVGGGAPTGLPGFPVGPLGIGAQGGRSSPFVEPPRFAIPPQPPQPAGPNDPLAAIGGMGRPALPVSRQAGHTPSSSLSPFPASGPPIIQGPRGGAPGGLVALANQILSNLKAPLHQNLYFTQIQILLSQIQQLFITTQQQPQPPPQLQAAQLQIQNLVAQVRLLAQKGDPGGARAGAGDAGAVSSGGGALVDKEIVESVERRIREHERMEIRRRWKAGKIASMVSQLPRLFTTQ
jgi:DNA topoisomerase 2-associated protein PAT1